MSKKRFLRTDSNRYSRLGKNKRKLQKWRKPKGGHNKIREKRFGHPKSPSIGYRKSKKVSGKIKGLNPFLVNNIKDLSKTDKNSIIIIGKVGAKKKLEIIKKATDMKLTLANLSWGGKANAAK